MEPLFFHVLSTAGATLAIVCVGQRPFQTMNFHDSPSIFSNPLAFEPEFVLVTWNHGIQHTPSTGT